MKNGIVKKKNGDGMTGILTDKETGNELVWVDRNAEANGIQETDPPQDVNYEEADLPGFGPVATSLNPSSPAQHD